MIYSHYKNHLQYFQLNRTLLKKIDEQQKMIEAFNKLPWWKKIFFKFK